MSLSPDGKTLATYRGGADPAIWLNDIARGGETRLTSPPSIGGLPVWSADGKMIAFASSGKIYAKDVAAGGKEELLLDLGPSRIVSDWSRDGRYLIYTETVNQVEHIWYLLDPLNKSGQRKAVPFFPDEPGMLGRLSPDGKWLTYVSDYVVYVRPFPAGQGKWKVSSGGLSTQPVWRADGKELYYLRSPAPNIVMSVAVQTKGDEFQGSTPQALFTFQSVPGAAQSGNYAYSPMDVAGQRFMISILESNEKPVVNLFTNWQSMAPAGK